jgi:hypothetical protein
MLKHFRRISQLFTLNYLAVVHPSIRFINLVHTLLILLLSRGCYLPSCQALLLRKFYVLLLHWHKVVGAKVLDLRGTEF